MLLRSEAERLRREHRREIALAAFEGLLLAAGLFAILAGAEILETALS